MATRALRPSPATSRAPAAIAIGFMGQSKRLS
jgi:hypothetical protein